MSIGTAVALGKTQGLFTDVIQEKKAERSAEEIQAEIDRRLAELDDMPDGKVH